MRGRDADGWLHASIHRGVLDGATWALDTAVAGGCPTEVGERVHAIRTDLDRCTLNEQQILERHGYLVADAAIHAHAAQLIRVHAPRVPPHDEVADPAYALAALRDSDRRTLLGRF